MFECSFHLGQEKREECNLVCSCHLGQEEREKCKLICSCHLGQVEREKCKLVCSCYLGIKGKVRKVCLNALVTLVSREK